MNIPHTVLLAVLLLSNPIQALAESTCPRTIGTDSLGPPFPERGNWHGSEALAVSLPADGTWQTTAPGAQIAVKLFWWSAGFQPGMESNLHVTIRELNGAPLTAQIGSATNAGARSLGGWTMLTGIDFPTTGCWEITGNYRGQVLTFVVETVPRKAAQTRG